jgi:hypothetical protein
LNGSSIALMVPLILVMTKILILPLLSRVIIENIMSANNNETLELSNFGFLYGTFPSAPTVFIFGLQYDISLTVVSTGIVMSTILSAPLMFVSANMIRLSSNSLPYIALQEDLGLGPSRFAYTRFAYITICIHHDLHTSRFAYITICIHHDLHTHEIFWRYSESGQVIEVTNGQNRFILI